MSGPVPGECHSRPNLTLCRPRPTLFFVSQGSCPRKIDEQANLTVKLIPTPKPIQVNNRGVSQGAEFAGGIVVFFLMGLALDAWLDTTPVFMISLVLFATIGQFVKIWYEYSNEMQRLEAERAESNRSSRGAVGRG